MRAAFSVREINCNLLAWSTLSIHLDGESFQQP